MVNLASFVSVSVTVVKKTITKQMYGWTKYGGARHGIVKTDPDVWYCQCCGDKQAKSLASYMYLVGDREYIRLCAKCWAETLNGLEIDDIKKAIFMPKTVWDLFD